MPVWSIPLSASLRSTGMPAAMLAASLSTRFSPLLQGRSPVSRLLMTDCQSPPVLVVLQIPLRRLRPPPAATPQEGQKQGDIRRVIPLRLRRILTEDIGLPIQAQQRVHPVIRRQEDSVPGPHTHRVLPRWQVLPPAQERPPHSAPHRVPRYPEHPPAPPLDRLQHADSTGK